MREEDIIYTDGHGVKITREQFQVEDKAFYLNGITSIDLQRIPAANMPGIILFLLGFLAIIAGSLDIFSNISYNDGETIYTIDSNMAIIAVGVGLIIIGIIRMIVSKDKYAVRIGTAEGEKQPFVTKNREHAAIIVASLKKAYYRHAKESRHDGKEKAESIVIP